MEQLSELDPLQAYAVDEYLHGNNLFVTMKTGSGKTRIAEHAIHHCLQGSDNAVIWYTTPIKALSNDKYLDFCRLFSEENVSLLTGDLKVNHGARIVVATTEILLTALQCGEVPLGDLGNPGTVYRVDSTAIGLVVFDEAHYINEPSRGYAWEESIIRLRKTPMILLSATVSNPSRLQKWLERLTNRKFSRVSSESRAVPLTISYWPNRPTGVGSEPSLRTSTVKRVVEHLEQENLTPSIVWVLSKRLCEKFSESLQVSLLDYSDSSRVDSILSAAERRFDSQIFNDSERRSLRNGIAYHHSGMTVLAKEMVEHLFKAKLLRVIFATETFSVGINLPARSVVFTSMTKYSDTGYRLLNCSEFLQMAGRAGRRGIDTRGDALVLSETLREPVEEIDRIMKGKPESIRSRYRLTLRGVLYSPECLASMTFLPKGEKEDCESLFGVVREYMNATGLLHDGVPTARGRAASRFGEINGLFALRVLESEPTTPKELIRTLSMINSPESSLDDPAPQESERLREIEESLMRELSSHGLQQGIVIEPLDYGSLPVPLLDDWFAGETLEKIAEKNNLEAGAVAKELVRVKNIILETLLALKDLGELETLERVCRSGQRLFRRPLMPLSFHMSQR